jgi:hypothetical protein
MNDGDRLPIRQLVSGVYMDQLLAFSMYSDLKVVYRVLKCVGRLGDGLKYGQSLGRRTSALLIGWDTSYSIKPISPASFDLEVHRHISIPMMYESFQRRMEWG